MVGDGYLCAAPPGLAEKLFGDVERSWSAAGRSGRPRMVAQVNVAIGPESTQRDALAQLHSYYGSGADRAIQNMRTTPRDIRDVVAAFGDLGADEVMPYCWSGDIDQIDRLADVLA